MKSKRAIWLRIIAVVLSVILLIVWIKRDEIKEMKITQKKMELFKALYHQDVDSAKVIIQEAIDSSFYIR